MTELKSLTQYPQSWNMQPCPYCGGKVVLVANKNLYGYTFGNGMCYLCLNCLASCGVYTEKNHCHLIYPAGLLCGFKLKRAHQELQQVFDWTWKTKQLTKSQAQTAGIRIIAQKLHMPFIIDWLNYQDTKYAISLFDANDWWKLIN